MKFYGKKSVKIVGEEIVKKNIKTLTQNLKLLKKKNVEEMVLPKCQSAGGGVKEVLEVSIGGG